MWRRDDRAISCMYRLYQICLMLLSISAIVQCRELIIFTEYNATEELLLVVIAAKTICSYDSDTPVTSI